MPSLDQTVILCEPCSRQFVGLTLVSEHVGTCACHGGILGMQKPSHQWAVPAGGLRRNP